MTNTIKPGFRLHDGSYAGKTKTSGTIKPMQQPTSHGGTSILSMPEDEDKGSMWLWGLAALGGWLWYKKRRSRK